MGSPFTADTESVYVVAYTDGHDGLTEGLTYPNVKYFNGRPGRRLDGPDVELGCLSHLKICFTVGPTGG